MDQNIKEQNEQFDKFTQFNQEDKCENIDEQIKQLEEFQGKLKELKGKEIEYLYQFELIIKNVGQENKSQQEKEILFLNNQLQTRHKEYAKALQQIKFSSQSVELFQQMNQQTESLQKELQYEILILDKLLENYKGNILLSAKTQRDMQTKNQKQSEKIQDLLKKFQKNCLKNGQKLENIITNVSQKKEFYFYPMDDKLIKNCEYLKIQEEELSIVLTSINQKIFTQQLTPQLLNELKEHILKVFADIDELMKKIPENNEIEEFNNHYIKNLESYEKVYALINYIKQYHSTRYQERIKEHANQQKLKQQNNKESDYQKQFYSKLNVDQEENTKKEKEAQDILLRYENVLFKNYNMMTIEAMQKDKIQIEKTTVELENYIKQKDLVKFRSKLKDQSKIKDIIQKYQIFELIQQKLFEEILQKQINQSGQSL
ncbi:unnamed protein product (macronuclear) [Paramecium tetraurelia]|uniref:Uncharacterized protein n=1 Tax=Paramecium tetraurelia TaxID=5888 RepID=A0CHW5_PARTE|nr:uncharacterized protein GSPATT00038484001 [Paramecium tetraurelia]CAK70382.1 unnamed protein product [Paramecium tetraurelia]|eukprot:XP_001437779.1 hypothetical protein (macronuclear) [Paramecium tetraurelia strain d4-2]